MVIGCALYIGRNKYHMNTVKVTFDPYRYRLDIFLRKKGI